MEVSPAPLLVTSLLLRSIIPPDISVGNTMLGQARNHVTSEQQVWPT